MVQEDAQVGWVPVAISYSLPWQAKLLILYLAFVSVWTIAKMIWVYRLTLRAPTARGLEVCAAKLRWVRRWVVLTVLFAAVACADLTAEFFRQMSAQKVSSPGLIFATFSELFTIFATAMVVSTVIYALAMWCESRLEKHRMQV